MILRAMRSILTVLWTYGMMTLVGIVFLPTLLVPGRLPTYAAITWAALARFGLRWIGGIRIEFRGMEHFPDQPVLIAGKHQSMIDTIVPFLMRGTRPVIVLKRELRTYPIFGWYAIRMQCIPIDRSASAQALKDMVSVSRKRLSEGRDILIFPEGTRQVPGAAPDYKPGVAALYRALDVACVPMATNAGLCWPAKGLMKRPGVMVYEILPPIAAGLNRKVFAAELEAAIEGASERLLDEGLGVQGRSRSDLPVPVVTASIAAETQVVE